MHTEKNQFYLPLIKAFTCMCLCAVLAACVPNKNLPLGQKAPPVTGPIDQYFPEGALPKGVSRLPTPNQTLVADAPKIVSPAKGDIKIAILLPLSGATKAMAKDMLDAAMLAVYDSTSRFEGGYTLTLLPKDTADSPSVAANVANQAIKEGASIIIGPLYSQSVDTVKNIAGKTPIIALSNNVEVKGDHCFIFGLTPENEAERIAEFGLKQGQLHWAALVPNNGYGMKLEAALTKSVTGKGGQITASERYTSSKAGMRAGVERIAEKIKLGRVNALFVGDDVENSAFMLGLLRDQQVDLASLHIYGTSQWHHYEKALPDSLVGAHYTTTNERAFERFAKRFRATNKKEPMAMSAVAYDAVMLVAEIAGHGNIPDRLEFLSKDTIQGPATGAYRFEPDGSVNRSLAIYKLSTQGREMVENAPKQF